MSGTFQVVKTEEWTGAPYGDDGFVEVVVPDPLMDWLTDLALLRAVPLHYLVPDPALLPLESMRFVRVDPALVTRLLDGALAAAALGGADLALGAQFRAGVFRRVARELAWRAEADRRRLPLDRAIGIVTPRRTFEDGWEHDHQPPLATQPPWEGAIAGVLIRSELVRHYPSTIVRASAGGTPLGCVRREQLAPSIMLVLFHGPTVPDRIELQEPDEGVRFGVEPADVDPALIGPHPVYELDYRPPTAMPAGGPGRIAVPVRSAAEPEVLAIGGLAQVIAARQGGPADSTSVARCLQQTPFVQIIGDGPRPTAWEPGV